MQPLRERPIQRRLGRRALLVAMLALGGCAAAGSRTSDGVTRDLIPEEAVRGIMGSAPDAYQVVNRLRPQWLRSRATTSIQNPGPDYPVVYLDGTSYGPIESLRIIDSASIREIRFLNASDATTRFGTGHTAGAILVVSRR